MTITKQHNGLLLSDIIKGQYVKKLYIGYTRKEAQADFIIYCKNYAYLN